MILLVLTLNSSAKNIKKVLNVPHFIGRNKKICRGHKVGFIMR